MKPQFSREVAWRKKQNKTEDEIAQAFCNEMDKGKWVDYLRIAYCLLIIVGTFCLFNWIFGGTL